jgi:hypothetical protein
MATKYSMMSPEERDTWHKEYKEMGAKAKEGIKSLRSIADGTHPEFSNHPLYCAKKE